MESTHASPSAPVFSPITPQMLTHNPLTTVDTPGSATPQQTSPIGQSNVQSPMPANHSGHSEFYPVSCSSPKPASSPKWSGFKVVIDNIDMNLKLRHQTFERRTRSIHYVNTYAALDRIDLSKCSTMTSDTQVSVASILPNDGDRRNILENFAVLAGRILCQCIPVLQGIPGLETSHIRHVYSEEMSSRTELVCEFHFTNAHNHTIIALCRFHLGS